MMRVSGTRYRILGYVVWHGGKWYLRRRLPSARTLALSVLTAVTVLSAAAILTRRLAS
jgi:hypothetical protein